MPECSIYPGKAAFSFLLFLFGPDQTGLMKNHIIGEGGLDGYTKSGRILNLVDGEFGQPGKNRIRFGNPFGQCLGFGFKFITPDN